MLKKSCMIRILFWIIRIFRTIVRSVESVKQDFWKMYFTNEQEIWYTKLEILLLIDNSAARKSTSKIKNMRVIFPHHHGTFIQLTDKGIIRNWKPFHRCLEKNYIEMNSELAVLRSEICINLIWALCQRSPKCVWVNNWYRHYCSIGHSSTASEAVMSLKAFLKGRQEDSFFL